jgi:BirA family biotin operon repressor/biotin-[acetyl-CoA-carboxylase] ligase
MGEDILDRTAILAGLRTATLPGELRCYRQVGSTMDVARKLLSELADEQLPLLVLADEQTSGRGRRGRQWQAAPGSALLLSLAMRPRWLPAARAVALVWMAGVALCEAVEQQSGLEAALKWPNDLLLPLPGGTHAKAAGILLEAGGSAALDWAIVGMGLNVSDSPPAVDVRYPATSLSAACGRPVGRLDLLRALLLRLDHWHARLIGGDAQVLFEAWRRRLHTLGRDVVVSLPSGALCGRAEAVDRDGALLLRDAYGRLHTISGGDVGMA